MLTLVSIFRLIVFTTLFTISLFAFALVKHPQEEPPLEHVGICGNALTIDTRISGHPGELIFQQNCKACHRLDQKLVGPALRHSFQTRDSVWFVKMIVDPTKLIKSGDTAAVNLFNRYYHTAAPTFTNFKPQELADLVAYLKLAGEEDRVID